MFEDRALSQAFAKREERDRRRRRRKKREEHRTSPPPPVAGIFTPAFIPAGLAFSFCFSFFDFNCFSLVYEPQIAFPFSDRYESNFFPPLIPHQPLKFVSFFFTFAKFVSRISFFFRIIINFLPFYFKCIFF